MESGPRRRWGLLTEERMDLVTEIIKRLDVVTVVLLGASFLCLRYVFSSSPLTACTACKKNVSRRAYTCPHCGEPFA